MSDRSNDRGDEISELREQLQMIQEKFTSIGTADDISSSSSLRSASNTNSNPIHMVQDAVFHSSLENVNTDGTIGNGESKPVNSSDNALRNRSGVPNIPNSIVPSPSAKAANIPSSIVSNLAATNRSYSYDDDFYDDEFEPDTGDS